MSRVSCTEMGEAASQVEGMVGARAWCGGCSEPMRLEPGCLAGSVLRRAWIFPGSEVQCVCPIPGDAAWDTWTTVSPWLGSEA